jgi:tRNA pseudouridine65 synthase
MSQSLTILFQDTHYVAIQKPSGFLVHPSALSTDRVTCLSLLRDQIGQWLYPVHRLDRQTSGVLIFALTSEAARELMTTWPEGGVRKTYQAICRGFMPESGTVDRALRETQDKPRVPARSVFKRLETVEFPDAVGPYPSARYSRVEVETLTGRYHQVRKHLVSLSHPIVGDTVYGDGDHNRYFREKFGIQRLLLHAWKVEFTHPQSGETLKLEAPLTEEFDRVFEKSEDLSLTP